MVRNRESSAPIEKPSGEHRVYVCDPDPRDYVGYNSTMTYPVQPPTGRHHLLWGSIPPARMATFLSHTSHHCADEALELYVWNRDLSMAFMADLAVLEVALREAIHAVLTEKWGVQWYQEMPLDDRSRTALASAWERLPAHVRLNSEHGDLPGRLVANCMFGFWTNLFDKGGYTGRGPWRRKVDNERNWPVLAKAFPGGRREAARQRDEHPEKARAITFSRVWVHQLCQEINELRNRVAHHEPLLNGVPLRGQTHRNEKRRRTVEEAFAQILSLARMIDTDLATWLVANSEVPGVMARKCEITSSSRSFNKYGLE